MRPKKTFDLKSQHLHNRLVNDLRKNTEKQNLPERQDKNKKISKCDFHTTKKFFKTDFVLPYRQKLCMVQCPKVNDLRLRK